MSCYEIKYSRTAEKFIRKNKIAGIKFMKAFMEIAQDREYSRNYDIKKFYSSAYDDIFRLRIGKYRAIFRVVETEILIYIFDIDSRGDIYK